MSVYELYDTTASKDWVSIRVNNLTVDGASSVAGPSTFGSLTVTGATALNGGLTMDTDKFTVANATGNTLIAGTLGVTGAITGTLATASQPNVTSVGTLTSLTSGTASFSGSIKRLAFVTVTQLTSTATAVTNNAECGTITTFSQSAVANASDKFVVNNTQVLATDMIVLNIQDYAGVYGTNGIPHVNVDNISAGSFDIVVSNVHGTNALSGALVLNYHIIHTV